MGKSGVQINCSAPLFVRLTRATALSAVHLSLATALCGVAVVADRTVVEVPRIPFPVVTLAKMFRPTTVHP